MASMVMNRAVKEGADGTWAYLTSTIKMMLVATATPYTPNVDHDFVRRGRPRVRPADALLHCPRGAGHDGGW